MKRSAGRRALGPRTTWCSSRPETWSSRCGTALVWRTTACVSDTPGWGGVTLALNLGSPAEVNGVTEQARAAGATIGREPAETFWGGYSSVFIDPEGHPWEIAHNPHWTLTPEGGVRLAG